MRRIIIIMRMRIIIIININIKIIIRIVTNIIIWCTVLGTAQSGSRRSRVGHRTHTPSRPTIAGPGGDIELGCNDSYHVANTYTTSGTLRVKSRRLLQGCPITFSSL